VSNIIRRGLEKKGTDKITLWIRKKTNDKKRWRKGKQPQEGIIKFDQSGHDHKKKGNTNRGRGQ